MGKQKHKSTKKTATFEKMITPGLIKVLYWIILIGILVTGVILIRNGMDAYSDGEILIASGVITILAGSLLWRVICEIAIVFFKMLEKLTEISTKLDRNDNEINE